MLRFARVRSARPSCPRPTPTIYSRHSGGGTRSRGGEPGRRQSDAVSRERGCPRSGRRLRPGGPPALSPRICCAAEGKSTNLRPNKLQAIYSYLSSRTPAFSPRICCAAAGVDGVSEREAWGAADVSGGAARVPAAGDLGGGEAGAGEVGLAEGAAGHEGALQDRLLQHLRRDYCCCCC